MDKTKVIQEVKNFIGNNELDEAFDSLSDFFQLKKESYNEHDNTLLYIRREYASIVQKENRGIISHEAAQLERNKISDRLINLLESLEKEEKQPKPQQSLHANRRNLYAVLTLLFLGVLAMVLWRLAADRSTTNNQELQLNPDDIKVQSFKTDALFKVAIFPFKPLQGAFTNVHESIKTRMGFLADNNDINLDAKIFPLNPESQSYPNLSSEATQLVNGWNVDLVIWGNTYQEETQNTTLTRYKFMNQDEFFRFHKLSLDETDGALVDTITTISSIATDGVLTEDIESILLGIVAFMKGNNKGAIALLKGANVSDSSTVLVKNMVLAEAYLEEGDKENAIEAYDEVIETHPDYSLAHNNRGMLFYDTGKPGQAVLDFDATLALSKDNPQQIQLFRARAYEDLGLLAKAKEDYSDIQARSGTISSAVKTRIEEVEKKAKKEENRLQSAKDRLRKSPDDREALETVVDASVKIGQYENATNEAQKLLQIDPTSLPAYANKIKAMIADKKPKEALQVYREARQRGLDSLELLKAVPMLEKLFDARVLNQQ